MEDLEVKAERSMPVQSRIDLVELAEIVGYWERRGIYVRTMSQLVSWSVSAFKEILKNNGLIEEIDTLEYAYDLLNSKGLIQKSMHNKMKAKYAKARGMENIRLDGMGYGVDRDTRAYQELHGRNQVQPFTGVYSKEAKKAMLEEQFGMSLEEALKKGEELRKKREEEEELTKKDYRPKSDDLVIAGGPLANKKYDKVMTQTTKPSQPQLTQSGDQSDAPAGIDLEESQRLAREADERLKDF